MLCGENPLYGILNICVKIAQRVLEFLTSVDALKNRAPNENITLKENNRIIKDQREVAETLNDYFTNVTKSTNMHRPVTIQDQLHASNTVDHVADSSKTCFSHRKSSRG